MKNNSLKFEHTIQNGILTIKPIGDVKRFLDKDMQTKLKALQAHNCHKIIIDLKEIKFIDFLGVYILHKMIQTSKMPIELINKNNNIDKIANKIPKNIDTKSLYDNKTSIQNIKQYLQNRVKGYTSFMLFVGQFWAYFSLSIINPLKFRLDNIADNIKINCVEVLPVVILASFFIGLVFTYQTLLQLRQFGMDSSMIDLSMVFMLREMCPVIAAIIIAGRSASSFSAQLAGMKMTQEIDALRVSGIWVFEFLIIPRIVSLLIGMPIVFLISNLMGIMSIFCIAYVHLDISFEEYYTILHSSLMLDDLWIGILKAPMFAFCIGIIGCFYGMNARLDTQSIRRCTTKSVVSAIFWVFMINAAISIIFAPNIR